MSDEGWRVMLAIAAIVMTLVTAGMLWDGQDFGFAIKWGLITGPGYLIFAYVIGVIAEQFS